MSWRRQVTVFVNGVAGRRPRVPVDRERLEARALLGRPYAYGLALAGCSAVSEIEPGFLTPSPAAGTSAALP